ncbi:MAG: peptidoglycan-binding domain-containing protein [Acidobacteriaceae bacterium]
MQFKLIGTTLLASLLLLISPAYAAHIHHHSRHSRHKAHVKAVRGQRQIDSERATQIQTALIKAGYLQGVPSGAWDTKTEAAMRKLQADNGWQTKITPDSRALIKLGLGPSQDVSTASVPVTGNSAGIGALNSPAETGASN